MYVWNGYYEELVHNRFYFGGLWQKLRNKARGISFFALFFLFCSSVLYPQTWDVRALHKVNGNGNIPVTRFNKGVSGSLPVFCVGVPVAIGIASLVKRDEKLMGDAIYVGSTVFEAAVLSFGMKQLIRRERPGNDLANGITVRSHVGGFSFPSGHTASAFALATSLSIRYPKWYVIVPSALWAGAVGYSRMQLGVHYPTDVIGGACLGIGTAVANVYVNRWLNRLIFPERRKRVFFRY